MSFQLLCHSWLLTNMINHHIQSIVCFGVCELRHDFVFKKRISGLREEGIYKLLLTLTPKRCDTILDVTEQIKNILLIKVIEKYFYIIFYIYQFDNQLLDI